MAATTSLLSTRVPCTPRPSARLSGCSSSISSNHSRVHRQLQVTRRGRVPTRACAGQQFGVVIETDTIAIDTHNDGHRVAFNKAFDDLGLSCASWPPNVYMDLRRAADGTALGMIRLYFETVGWPTFLPNAEHKSFAEQILKQKDKAFRQLLKEGQIPLRQGVTQFVDDALADGVNIALLCGTNSVKEDDVGSAAAYSFGIQRARHMQIINTWGEEDGPEQPARGSNESNTSELTAVIDSLALEAAAAQQKVKQKEAIAFTQNMKHIGVDPHILSSTRKMGSTVMSRAANALGVGAMYCAVLSANELTLQSGRGAGMTAVCVTTSRSGRFRPPSAEAVYDGFGAGGGCTWNRVRHLLEQKTSS